MKTASDLIRFLAVSELYMTATSRGGSQGWSVRLRRIGTVESDTWQGFGRTPASAINRAVSLYKQSERRARLHTEEEGE